MHTSRVHSVPEEVQSQPYPGSGVHRGQIPDRPGQTVRTGGPDRRASSPGQILLQGRLVQTSSPLPELARPYGCYSADDRVCPPLHAPHPVVPETPLEQRNPRVATPDPCHQGSGPSAPVVVGQGAPLPGNAFFYYPVPPSLSLSM